MKKYSRANTRSGKAHVIDHKSGKILCGSAFRHTVMVTTKSRYNATDMLERHSAIPKRRVKDGGKNPYKFCCQKCEDKIRQIANLKK